VAVTRYAIHAGERIEILVNCTGQNGTSVDLKAYNSSLSQTTPGGDILPPNTIFVNALARKDFNLLHLNIGPQTSNPITTIPTVLRTITTIPAANANITRNLTIADGPNQGASGVLFLLNNKVFDITHIDYSVPLNNTEIWQITNSGNFGHPFHIHDVQFNILSVNGVAPTAAQAGWKDVVFVPSNTVIRFIAKFEDYADALHPFMFHCHIALHEDDGMMGQFVVTGNPNTINELKKNEIGFSLYPNPVNSKLYVTLDDADIEVYYITITNTLGKAVIMLPQPEIQKGIEIAHLTNGTYFVQLTDKKTKTVTTRKFVKQ